MSNVVAGEGGESEIGVGSYCGVEINEGLRVAGRCDGVLGLGGKLGIGEESINGIWLDLWSVTIWLSCTREADSRGGGCC